MATTVLRYRDDGRIRWGAVNGDRVAPLDGEWATTGAFLTEGGPEAARAATDFSLDAGALETLSPITADAQVVCQGVNYRSHRIESGLDPDGQTFNMLFRKASSCLSSGWSPIRKPAHVTLLDYEVELGLVVGAPITGPRTFTEADIGDVIAGLVIFDDVSARDIQVPQGQFFKGKSYRTFGPTGPWLVLVDGAELKRWRELRLRLEVDGQVRQEALAGDMVYGPAPTLTELSGLMDLRPGDLIATGTPGGVALKAPSALAQKIGALLPEATRWRLFAKGQAKSERYLRVGQ
ncbi:MAG: fumarylacetoacetate hydrolase family protein, partial [Myxococcales bacterium]|nr:fumarylacetoacetate hydrolase family protein [Myxococcales bacterium]